MLDWTNDLTGLSTLVVVFDRVRDLDVEEFGINIRVLLSDPLPRLLLGLPHLNLVSILDAVEEGQLPLLPPRPWSSKWV